MNIKKLVGLTILILISALFYSASGSFKNENKHKKVSEEAFNLSGQSILEKKTEDWVSYYNPRDDFHPEYQKDPESPVPSEVMDKRPGSGKICTTLLNEAGEPIEGSTVENTTISIDIQGLEWHSFANPFKVKYPLSNHYEYPLDGDQFGTSEDFPQGDGILDSHCIEWHLESENMSLTYDKPKIQGQHEESIKFIGLIQKMGAWNSDKDPIEDSNNFDEYDGEFEYPDDETHGQVVFVFQLRGED